MAQQKDRLADYVPVSERLEQFRSEHPDYGLVGELLIDDGTRVLFRAEVHDTTGRIVAVGHAEEIRGQGPVNTTSAIENAETSAWGRALAGMGYEVKRGVASQEEMRKVHTRPATPAQLKAITDAAEAAGYDISDLLPKFTEETAKRWLEQLAERNKQAPAVADIPGAQTLRPQRPVQDNPLPEPGVTRLTEKQQEKILRLADAKKVDLRAWLLERGVDRIGNITADKAEDYINQLEQEPDPNQEVLPVDVAGWAKD